MDEKGLIKKIIIFCLFIHRLTLSVPIRFSAEKKKNLGNFKASFYAREKNLKSVFCSQQIELFHGTMKKKIENAAKYELFLPKPLTLALFC